MKINYNEYAEAALHMTEDIIDKHGPRVSGTEGCYSAGAELETILGNYCHSVKRESFWIHPNSLFAIGKIFTVIYLLGIIAVLIESKISMGIGLICMISGTIYFIMQFILFSDTFDGFFKKVSGNNITGIIEPLARQRIKTVSIIGMSTNMFRKEIVFHTMKDRPDKISKKAVRTVIEVVSEYIKKIEICNEGIRGRPYPDEILGDQPVTPTLCPPAPVPTLSPYRSMPRPDDPQGSSIGNN